MNRNETVRTLPTVYILRYIHQISRLFCRYYNFYFISLAHLLLFTKSKTVNLDRFDTSFVSRPFFQNCRITRFYGPDSHLFHRHFENFLLFIANFPPSFSLISITNPLQVKDISMFLHRGANFMKSRRYFGYPILSDTRFPVHEEASESSSTFFVSEIQYGFSGIIYLLSSTVQAQILRSICRSLNTCSIDSGICQRAQDESF